MKTFIIGAGAVGQVYGYCLDRAGANVTLHTKPKYRQNLEDGLAIYDLNRPAHKRWKPIEFDAYDISTSLQTLRERQFDQAYLCVSSTALRGDWFDKFARLFESGTVVLLQPKLDNREYVLEHFAEERVVQGMISIISFPVFASNNEKSDQKGLIQCGIESPGMAFWRPPFAKSPFGGARERVETLVRALAKGGMPVKHQPQVWKKAPYSTALLIPFVEGLARTGWSFDHFLSSEWYTTVRRAQKQALRVVAGKLGAQKSPVFQRMLTWPMVLSPVLRTLSLITPFDLETYLQCHFTKVKEQSEFILQGYVQRASKQGLRADAIEALLA